MANNNKKKGKLQSTSAKNLPSLNSTSTPKGSRYTNANADYFKEQRRTLIENRTLSVGANGPFRGVVLRVDEYYDRGHIPVGTWLEVYYNHLIRNSPAEGMPEKLVSYKVYIPELHSMLPSIKIYPGRAIVCDEHAKINLYPDFLAQHSADTNAVTVKPGAIVWVDFVDKTNQEDGLFVGPVFKNGDNRPAHAECRTAMQILLESCGVPPNAPTGGGWIGWDGLKQRMFDLLQKQKRTYEILYYLGGGKPQMHTDGTTYGHGGDLQVYPRIELGDVPAWLGKEYKAALESIVPWQLRGPSKNFSPQQSSKKVEQSEEAWMFPVWLDSPDNAATFTSNKDTMIGYVKDIGIMMDMIKNDRFTQVTVGIPAAIALGTLTGFALTGAAIAGHVAVALGFTELGASAVVSNSDAIIDSLSGKGTVDKAPFIREDYLESKTVANKKRKEMSQKMGLMLGTSWRLDPSDITTRLPETPTMRIKMIKYYEWQRDQIEITLDIIADLVKEKKAERQLENDKIKDESDAPVAAEEGEVDADTEADEQAGSGAALNCPDGDTFVPEYLGPNGPTTLPQMKMAKIKLDKCRGGRKHKDWRNKKNMVGHPKDTALIRGDVYQKMSSIVNIINNLGGVIDALGPDIGSEDQAGRWNAQIGRDLGDMPKPGERGKSKTSYHFIYKAIDINGGSTTLSLGGEPTGGTGKKRFTTKKPDGTYDIGKLKERAEYVLEFNNKLNRFVVWAKTNYPAGTAAPSHPQFKVERVTLQARVCGYGHTGPADTVEITGDYINITKIFKHFGFASSGPVRGWKRHCHYFTDPERDGKRWKARSEWWHFQLPEPRGTTWGDALKTIYTEEQLEGRGPYKRKNYVAGPGGWFHQKKGKK